MKHFIGLIVIAFVHVCWAAQIYNVGIGIADVTGPAADINTVSFLFNFLRFSFLLHSLFYGRGQSHACKETAYLSVRCLYIIVNDESVPLCPKMSCKAS